MFEFATDHITTKNNLMIFKSTKSDFSSEDFDFYKTCKNEIKALGFGFSKFNNKWAFNLYIDPSEFEGDNIDKYYKSVQIKTERIDKGKSIYDKFINYKF